MIFFIKLRDPNKKRHVSEMDSFIHSNKKTIGFRIEMKAMEGKKKYHHQIDWQVQDSWYCSNNPVHVKRLFDSEKDCCALVNLRCIKLSIMGPETTKEPLLAVTSQGWRIHD